MSFAASQSFSHLENLTIAVCGYGNQGRSHALNLRDSGLNVLIGSRRGHGFDRSLADGFAPISIEATVQKADIIMLSLPDVLLKEIFQESILGHLRKGQTLLFAHGFAILYGLVVAPEGVNVALVSPKAAGVGVRRNFEQKIGIPALIGVHQDPGGTSLAISKEYAQAIGATLILETSFKNETETDLFGEQAVLCGGIPELIRSGFDTLVNAGYPPELAYFECLHESKLVVDILVERGIAGMREAISDTAAWGGLIAGPTVVNDQTRQTMKQILSQIQSGEFAKEWIEESADRQKMRDLMAAEKAHLSENIGRELREKIFSQVTG